MRKNNRHQDRKDKLRGLVRLQGWRCYYCGLRIGLEAQASNPMPDDLATLDHAIPTSRGGTNSIMNLVAACYRCNSDKSDMTLQEFTGLRGSHNGRGLPDHAINEAKDAQRLRTYYRITGYSTEGSDPDVLQD